MLKWGRIEISKRNIILKLLSFTLAFVIVDTLITYYGISLEWVPAYLETSIVYNLYGLDAFLLGKFAIGALVIYIFYRNLISGRADGRRAYSMILLAFASVSWFAVISNILVIIDINYLLDIYYLAIVPVSTALLFLHGLWWMRLKI
ncbi:MAG: hypothetical protein RMJ59_00620 [Candidatus Nitrosocaldus sp.]|nr:hypothetical protein [Candidatus Nitrosocaldus sp.]MDW8274867.1 hypothetical protein [Candidatus Nitrosocaldus sp.]